MTFSLSLRGTTILALYTNEAAWIAADSLLSSEDSNHRELACKVHITDSFVWASMGIAKSPDGAFQISRDVVDPAVKENASLEKTAESIAKAMEREWGKLDSAACDGDRGKIDFGISLSEVVPPFNAIYIKAANTGVVTSCHRTKGLSIGKFGEVGRVEEILETRPAIWTEMGIEAALEFLIEQQALATPKKVGGPVTIVRTDLNGPQYVKRGPAE